jgi:coenzyme F420 biosynthesis associated uncharacterized protein
MVDWQLAERVAAAVAGGEGGAEIGPDLAQLARESEQQVGEYTRLHPASPLPAAELVTRTQWTQVNLKGIRLLLDPVAARLGAGMGPLAGPIQAGAGLLIAAEVGLVTGYMGQRILGQYEVALLDPDAPPRLLFVAENLREAVNKLDAPEPDLVRWIALHEVTHALQFAGVPWLRGHLTGLLGELMSMLEMRIDPRSLARMPSRADVRGWAQTVREGGLVALVAGPEQRAALDRLQALMSLLEGYAEHVMDAVGAQVVPSLPQLRAALERRRHSRPPLERLLNRLLGLDLKLRQYEQGKAFCDAVAAAEGIEGLNRAWRSPESVPTLSELADPDAWLDRTRVPIVTSFSA